MVRMIVKNERLPRDVGWMDMREQRPDGQADGEWDGRAQRYGRPAFGACLGRLRFLPGVPAPTLVRG